MVAKVEVVVLGLLAGEPLYGYELLERFRDRAMGQWVEVGKASIYQALRRLEARGLVSGRAQEGTEGPDRRVYRITKTGRVRLREGLLERFSAAGRPYETDAALSLAFAHLLSADQVRRGIEARVAALVARRKAIAADRDRLAERGMPRWAIAVRMIDEQDALARAELVWLSGFARDLAKLRRSGER